MAEYEACIAKMEALRELGVKEAEVFGDSTLFIFGYSPITKVVEGEGGTFNALSKIFRELDQDLLQD